MLNLQIACLASLTGAGLVAAHGHVSNVIVNGLNYRNFDPTADIYLSNPPITAGWYAGDSDNGFVAPDAYGSSDIICHRNSTPAKAHIQVAAGSVVSLQWTAWPDSHKGPVLDYLANCNGACESVDKTTLKFFKIDGAGLVAQGNPGTYASDTLIANNNTWDVRIPADLAPGNYVLRHEIIALHSAFSSDGAQNYPQCINLQVTGSGTAQPAAIAATSFYQSTDPGILFNLYSSSVNYIIPGPTIAADGISSISQTYPVVTGTGTATQGSATGVAGSSSAATTSTVRTTAATTTTTAKTTSTTTKSTTLATSTTKATSTTTTAKTTTTSAPAGTGGAQTVYGQCGGSGWTGPTACVAGAACASLNPYYSQCTST